MSGKCFALNNIFGIFFKRKKKNDEYRKSFFLYPEYMLAVYVLRNIENIYFIFIFETNFFFLLLSAITCLSGYETSDEL